MRPTLLASIATQGVFGVPLRNSMSTIPDEAGFDTLEDLMRLGEWPDESDTEATRKRDLRVPRVAFGVSSPELEHAVKQLTRVPVLRVMDAGFPRIHIGARGAELRAVFASGVRAAIVVDDSSRPIGAVTAASVVRAEADGKDLEALRVQDAVSLGITKLPPDTGLAQALEQMASSPDLPVAVVATDGTLAGGFESHHIVAWLGAGVVTIS
jgi:CBS domain-containing protein